MPKVHIEQEWEKDDYVKEWLKKVGERTRKNYIERYPKWLNFIGMTPKEQFEKRIKDLQSTNPKVRGFFEDKTVDFKNLLVTQKFKASSVQCTLTPVLSFFKHQRVGLKFARGELKVEARTEDKVIKEWIPDNQQAKQIYQHGEIRDRALFLNLYQSGFSETDVSSLSIEDLPEIDKCEGHYPITMYREKTNVLQRTCLSEEAVHDIKEMLKERENSGQLKPEKIEVDDIDEKTGKPVIDDKTGKPKKKIIDGRTPLFISQKGERLTVRFINDTIKGMVEKTYGKEQAEKFKTKSLRDAYNDSLLRANLTQEVKDTLFGHKREGAREKYAIGQATIIDAYNKAFQFMSVNHGTQARKDIETMRDQVREMRDSNDQTIKNLNKRIEYLERKLTKNGLTIDKMNTNIGEIMTEIKALRKEPEKVKLD